jgi:hypothetical protein
MRAQDCHEDRALEKAEWLTQTLVQWLCHGGEVPDEGLQVIAGRTDVTRRVRGPRQGVHRRLMPVELGHWQGGESGSAMQTTRQSTSSYQARLLIATS